MVATQTIRLYQSGGGEASVGDFFELNFQIGSLPPQYEVITSYPFWQRERRGRRGGGKGEARGRRGEGEGEARGRRGGGEGEARGRRGGGEGEARGRRGGGEGEEIFILFDYL